MRQMIYSALTVALPSLRSFNASVLSVISNRGSASEYSYPREESIFTEIKDFTFK
jgi:hypothetical protein